MKADTIREIKNKPDIISLTVFGGRSVLVKWCTAVGAEKYVVKRSVDKDGPFEKIAAVKNGITQIRDEDLTQGGTYWYKVIAHRKNGDEKLKKGGDAKCAELRQLEKIELTHASADKSGEVTLKWKSSDEADGYIVGRRYSFMNAPIELARTEKDETEYTDSDTVCGQLYYYSVSSYVSDDGTTILSDAEKEFPFIRIAPPFVLKTERKHGRKVRFSFRLTAGADRYIVLSSDEENGSYERCGETTLADNLVCTVTGKKGSRGAFYKFVCAKDADGSELLGEETKPVYIKHKF